MAAHDAAILAQLVVTLHQPLTAGAADIAESVKRRYDPLLGLVEEHEELRLAIYCTGHLLDHLARGHESWLFRLKALVRAGRAEILGGLFYGGAPALLPEQDARGQVQMAVEYWGSLLGVRPRGLWLAHFAWSPDVPRLLADSGFDYSFVSAAQLSRDASQTRLGSIEWGGRRLAAFVVESLLDLHQPDAPSRLHALLERRSVPGGGALTAWLDGERLSLEELRTVCRTARDSGQVRWVLPEESFTAQRPTQLLFLQESTLPARAQVLHHPVYRRMLWTSQHLSNAIATMQDEGLEEAWSDTLATAQRALYAAEAVDAFAGGQEEALVRLERAEAAVEGLLGARRDERLAVAAVDFDADFVEECWVRSAGLAAWILPQHGARLGWLEPRGAGRQLCGVWPTAGGMRFGAGSRDIAAPASSAAAAFLAGVLPPGGEEALGWDVEQDGLAAARGGYLKEGDYSCAVRWQASSVQGGLGQGDPFVMAKRLTVVGSEPLVHWQYRWEGALGAPAYWIVALPLRCGGESFSADGGAPRQVALDEVVELSARERLNLGGGEAVGVELLLQPGGLVWLKRCRADGGGQVQPGAWLLAFLVRVEGAKVSQWSMALRVATPSRP